MPACWFRRFNTSYITPTCFMFVSMATAYRWTLQYQRVTGWRTLCSAADAVKRVANKRRLRAHIKTPERRYVRMLIYCAVCGVCCLPVGPFPSISFCGNAQRLLQYARMLPAQQQVVSDRAEPNMLLVHGMSSTPAVSVADSACCKTMCSFFCFVW